jgi:hypothetical protein
MKEAVGHKGSNCPFSSAIQPILISDSSDDASDNNNSDEEE